MFQYDIDLEFNDTARSYFSMDRGQYFGVQSVAREFVGIGQDCVGQSDWARNVWTDFGLGGHPVEYRRFDAIVGGGLWNAKSALFDWVSHCPFVLGLCLDDNLLRKNSGE